MWTAIKGLVLATLSLIVLCIVAVALPAIIAGDHALGWALIGAYMGMLIVPAPVLLFGTLSHFGLRWLGRTSLRAYLWTAFGLSAFLALLIAIRLPTSEARGMIALFEILLILIGGPCAAIVFWYTVRPDRSMASKEHSPT